MPDVNWNKVKAEYIRGGTSYRKLASKYGVSLSSVSLRAKKEKWADLRVQTQHKTSTKIADSVADQEAKRVEMFRSISDKLLRKIDEGVDDGSLIVTARAVHDLTDAIKNLRDINDMKSDRDIREQEARIEKLRKDCQTEQTDNTIKVVIDGGLEDYAQ